MFRNVLRQNDYACSSRERQLGALGADLTDLIAWREAALLAGMIVRESRRLRGSGSRVLADQMVRAALSIPANIAEGYGRGRSADSVRFLRIARGSVVELESHVRVALLAGYCDRAFAEPLLASARKVRALVSGLMRTHAV